MAWSASKVFSAFVADTLDKTIDNDLDADAFKAAIYGDMTPDNTVVSANAAYNAGLWTSPLSSSTSWPAVGRPLVTPDVTWATTTIKWDAVDTQSADSACSISAFYGVLVYDDTLSTPVADQAVCYNYLGGSQTISSGLLTVVWHTNGIASFSTA